MVLALLPTRLHRYYNFGDNHGPDLEMLRRSVAVFLWLLFQCPSSKGDSKLKQFGKGKVYSVDRHSRKEVLWFLYVMPFESALIRGKPAS